MPSLLIPRSDDGAMILPGKTEHVREWDFASLTAVPSDLAVTLGTATVTSNGTTRGELVLSTPAAQYAQCTITLPGVNIGTAEAISLTFESMRTVPASQPSVLGIVMANATAGVSIKKDYNDQTFLMRFSGQTGTLPSSNLEPYVQELPPVAVSMSITLLLLPRRKMFYVLEGDQVMSAQSFPNMSTDGIAPPALFFNTNSASAARIAIAKIRLVTRTN